MLVMRVKWVNPNPTHLNTSYERLACDWPVYYEGWVVWYICKSGRAGLASWVGFFFFVLGAPLYAFASR